MSDLVSPEFNVGQHETLITTKLNLSETPGIAGVLQISCGPLRRNFGHLRGSGFVRCCCNARISWRKWTATSAILGDAGNC